MIEINSILTAYHCTMMWNTATSYPRDASLPRRRHRSRRQSPLINTGSSIMLCTNLGLMNNVT